MAGTIQTIIEIVFRGGAETRAQLQAIGKDGTAAFEKIEAQASKIPTSLRAVDAVMGQVKSQLVGSAEAFGPFAAGIEQIGGKAGFAALGVAALTGALLEGTHRAIEHAREISLEAEKLNITTDSYQKLTFATGQLGLSTEQSNTLLTRFERSIGGLQLGTGAFGKELKTLNPLLFEELRNVTNVGEAFEIAQKAIKNAATDTQGVALAVAAFGREGGVLSGLIRHNAESFDDLREKAERLGTVIGEDAIEAGRRAGTEFKTLSDVITSRLTQSFLDAAPAIETVLHLLTEAINFVIPGETSVEEHIKQLKAELDARNSQAQPLIDLGFSQETADAVVTQLTRIKSSVADLIAHPIRLLAGPDIAKQTDELRDLLAELEHSEKIKHDIANADKAVSDNALTAQAEEAALTKILEEGTKLEIQLAARERADALGLLGAARTEFIRLEEENQKKTAEFAKNFSRGGFSPDHPAASFLPPTDPVNAANQEFQERETQRQITAIEAQENNKRLADDQRANDARARAAEAARTRQASAEKAFIDYSNQLEDKRTKAGLQGISLILAESENEYAKLGELARNANISYADTEQQRVTITEAANNKILAEQQKFQEKTDRIHQALVDQGSTPIDRVNRRADLDVLDAEQEFKKFLSVQDKIDAARLAGDQETVDQLQKIEVKGQEELGARVKDIRETQEFNAQAATLETYEQTQRKLLEIGKLFVEQNPTLQGVGNFLGVSNDELARLFKGGQANAEEFAKRTQSLLNGTFRDIGQAGKDALHDLFARGKIDGKAFVDQLKDSIFNLLFDLSTQQIILPIVANLIGVTGGGAAGAGQVAGGGGGSVLSQGVGLLQQGQSLLSLGSKLKDGFGLLTDALDANTSAVTAFDVPVTGIAGQTAADASVAFDVAPSGVPGSVAPIGAEGGGLAGSIGGAASTAGIAFAILAAVETLQAGLGAIKQRDTFFSLDDAASAFGKGFDPITKALGNVVAFAFAGQSGQALLRNELDALNGKFTALSVLDTGILAILNPMAFNLAFFLKDLPTKGTVLRKGEEEFIENKDLGAGFFARDSGTFKRGIGQTGLSANDVHGSDLTARARDAIGQGARGIADEKGIDFVAAQKEFIADQQKSIGLTDKQEKQFEGFGAAFRAFVGDKAGSEDTRTFGVIADLLGSITAEGAGAAESIAIVQKAVAGLGRPELVFDKLTSFFKSSGNDIEVGTFHNAIEGLADAIFTDLPKGVDAGKIALDELSKSTDGATIDFQKLTDRIQAATLEANTFGPALEEAFKAGIDQSKIENLKINIATTFDPESAQKFIDQLDKVEVDPQKFGTDLFDAVTTQLKDSIAQAVFDGFIEGQFKGDILGPFLATLKQTIDDVRSGKITQAQGNQILATATQDARDNLELLRPLIEQAIASGKSLADVFSTVSDTADIAAAKAKQIDAFNKSIDRQILGFLSPDLAAQFDQEKTARERLHAARELGLDLNRVEELNGLEREALLKQQAEHTNDEIKKIHDKFIDDVVRAQDRIKDLLSEQLGSTNSPLPPQQALANAQATFAATAAAARGGDLKALEKVPEDAKRVEDIARQLFGTTDRFFAIFNPLVATEQEISKIDPKTLPIPPGDQEIVDTLNEHQAEAVALYNRMIDLLELTADGFDKADSSGTLTGDQVSKGVPGTGDPGSGGGTTSSGGGPKPTDIVGQFGLTAGNQAGIQGVIGGAKPGGETHKALVQLLNLPSLAAISSLSGGSLAQKIAVALLQLFPGATSKTGFDKVVLALDNKIFAPDVFSPVLGYAHGGIINSDRLVRVGEDDQPELILPFSKSRRSPEAQSAFESLVRHEGITGFARGGVVGGTALPDERFPQELIDALQNALDATPRAISVETLRRALEAFGLTFRGGASDLQGELRELTNVFAGNKTGLDREMRDLLLSVERGPAIQSAVGELIDALNAQRLHTALDDLIDAITSSAGDFRHALIDEKKPTIATRRSDSREQIGSSFGLDTTPIIVRQSPVTIVESSARTRSSDDVVNWPDIKKITEALGDIKQEINMSRQALLDELRELQTQNIDQLEELVRLRAQLRQRLSLPQ